MDQAKQHVNDETTEVQNEAEEANNVADAEQLDTEETVEVLLTEEEKQIQVLQTEVAELNNRLLRMQADYDNFRRRTRLDMEAAAKYKAQSLIEELIPAIDNFDRALAVKVDSDDAKSLLQGMEMVYRQLTDALKNEGLETIHAVGQSFDPHYHQAVMQVESDEHEPNQVIEELQKGYKLKDRVIRPTMVKVSQ
ncbi:nucleotide exchange factor GrpE [Anaerobacillus isosaccharinicus]|uniref:Protein GrpE n=1 Tax=Anaerobacillus isosaccharinicus TaxID=1532552 RepID=A0A1S2LTL0_9BACI|nr:nucleotide exchange factor GrpE [Anaerobacillus isosaccharinicus]MBA5585485.1 nucleotide exchange factor GrpE [Anaerobacillus isosaccharinicus]QOY36198.1 nucleotide exchange factor GrpE [Anaerobacillus isosaccharinicus]